MGRKIIVSHSTIQHSPYTAYAAYKGNRLLKYYVGYYFNSDKFHIRILSKIFGTKIIEKIKSKRYFENIDFDSSYIVNYPFFHGTKLLLESILRRLSINSVPLTYCCNIIFDVYISLLLSWRKLDGVIFIGYINSSLYSFKKVKQQGGCCVLDFATIDFREITRILKDEQFLSPEFKSDLGESNIPNIKRIQQEFQIADYILVPSTFSKKCLINNGVSPSKIKVLPYGSKFQIIEDKSFRYSKNGDSLRLVYVGQIQQKKGVKYLLEAIDSLLIEGLDIELNLIGNIYGDPSKYKKYKSFNHIGYLDKDELSRFLKSSDILILPSLFDSFGLVVLEAMSMGVMPIVSENTGAADCVTEDVGYVVPIRDSKSIAAIVKDLYTNRDKLNHKRKNAIFKAKDFTWDKYCDKFNNLMSNIC